MGYRLLPRARNDLDYIADYIAQDNHRAALSMFARFIESFELLAAQPKMGIALPEIGDGLRMMPVERYLIFYRIDNNDSEVVRVLHSAQEWREILSGSID